MKRLGKYIALADKLDKFGLFSSAAIIDAFIKIANQKNVLINKLKLSEEAANYLIQKCGKLSIWFANQFIISMKEFYPDRATPENISNRITHHAYDESITIIMDWVRHPAVGQIDLKKLTLPQALTEATAFHSELKASGGDVDYQEQNPVITKYDNGFYWAKIESNFSDEESERMGHCGRSGSADTLFSLRSNKPYGKDHTINDSHVTVAYNSSDGKIYQSKGKQNQKPAAKYFPYIYDLITKLSKRPYGTGSFENIQKPGFTGFSNEYAASEDFSYQDMTDEQIKELYSKNPEAFKGFKSQVELSKRKIIEKPNTISKLDVHISDISYFFKTPTNYRKDIIKAILLNDLNDDSPYHYWPNFVEYINRANIEKIINIAKEHDIDVETYDGNFKEMLKDNEDVLHDVTSAIINAVQSASECASYNGYHDEIKSGLKQYGDVVSLDETGATIMFDVTNLFDQYDDDKISEILDNNETDADHISWEAVFELLSDYTKKPTLNLRDYYPSNSEINEQLSELLG